MASAVVVGGWDFGGGKQGSIDQSTAVGRTDGPQPEEEQEADDVFAAYATAVEAQQLLQRALQPQPLLLVPRHALLQRHPVHVRIRPGLVLPQRRPRGLEVQPRGVGGDHVGERVHQAAGEEVAVVVGLPQDDAQDVHQRLEGRGPDHDVRLAGERVQLTAPGQEQQAELLHAKEAHVL